MTGKRSNQKSGRGPIEPHVVYPMQDFRRRVGFGDVAWRDARRNGLKVRYLHRRPFVLGSDFIDYLLEHGSDDPLCREGETEGESANSG